MIILLTSEAVIFNYCILQHWSLSRKYDHQAFSCRNLLTHNIVNKQNESKPCEFILMFSVKLAIFKVQAIHRHMHNHSKNVSQERITLHTSLVINENVLKLKIPLAGFHDNFLLHVVVAFYIQ